MLLLSQTKRCSFIQSPNSPHGIMIQKPFHQDFEFSTNRSTNRESGLGQARILVYQKKYSKNRCFRALNRLF